MKNSLIIQLLVLLVGVGLFLSRRQWSDPILALASGLFFINIFLVTVVLGNDLKIWSRLRNSLPGNLFMIGLILL